MRKEPGAPRLCLCLFVLPRMNCDDRNNGQLDAERNAAAEGVAARAAARSGQP